MGEKRQSPKESVIQCKLLPEVKKRIERFAEDLQENAHAIGNHGLSEQEFKDSGIFHSAVERLRGQQSASMAVKRDFLAEILDHLKRHRKIKSWFFKGAGERHDYEATMPNGRLVACEAKGCLDGNNTNIFIRPPNADEFIIWSLCQNPGSDPGHNAWSGIHTRLGAEIIARKERVDALVIWDMLCGTAGRPCPKLKMDATRSTTLKSGRKVPPPCIYLFPRTLPDPRNNPSPKCWTIEELHFTKVLHKLFKGEKLDVIEVHIDARMEGSDVQRMTTLVQDGRKLTYSNWTTIRRASQ